MNHLYGYSIQKKNVSGFIIYLILCLPLWCDSTEKSQTILFVTTLTSGLYLKVCKPSMWTLAKFWAGCGLIYLIYLSHGFLFEFFAFLLNWIKLNLFSLGAGEVLSFSLFFCWALVRQGQVNKAVSGKWSSTFKFKILFDSYSSRFLLLLSCWLNF